MPTIIPPKNILGVTVTVSPRSRGYEANFRITDPRGERQRMRKIKPTINEAFAWAEQVIDDSRKRVDVRKAGQTTVADLGELFTNEHRNVLGSSESTISNVRISFAAINKAIGHVTLQDLTMHHVNELRDALAVQKSARGEPLKLSSRRIYLGHLRSALRFAVEQGLVPHNVALNSKMPRRKKRTKAERFFYIPDHETMRDIIQCAGSLSIPGRAKPDLLLYEVQTFWFSQTGTRISEALNLEVTDIDRDELTVQVGVKTEGSLRLIPVAQELIDQLDRLSYRWKGGKGFVFVHENGERPHNSSVSYRLIKVGEHLGLPERLKPHLFRHYFVNTMLKRGVPMAIVSQLVGHDQISTTVDIYGHLEPRDGRRFINEATRDFLALLHS